MSRASHLTVAAFALALPAGGGSGPAAIPAGSAEIVSMLTKSEVSAGIAGSPTIPAGSAEIVSMLTISRPSQPDPAPPPDAPLWTTGPDVGMGVAAKDTGNPRGDNVFIGYAGYGVSVEDAEAWVDALYDAWLRDRGVRYVWAVRGPDDSHYEHKEIGNTKIGARLRAVAPSASFVLVAAHSSGSCVAHELFEQLAERDVDGATAGKIVYFNLDGIEKGLSSSSVARLRRAYFVGAVDRATSTASPNDRDMRRTAEQYAASTACAYVEHDARDARCASGGTWCLHVSLVTKAPHDPRAARAHLDYTDFAGGGVATAFFDAKADEAGLAAR